jgi:ribosome-associated protein
MNILKGKRMNQIEKLVQFIDEKQGQDIEILDMRPVSPFMDFMIVTHVSNPRLLLALSEYLREYFNENSIDFRPFDKNEESGWILIDANDIIVHLFLKEQRDLYQIEKLWKDTLIKRENISSL